MEHRKEEEPSSPNNNGGSVVDLTSLTSPFIDDNDDEDSEIEFLGTKKNDDNNKSNNIDGVADYRAAAKMKYEQSLLSRQHNTSSSSSRNQSITNTSTNTSTQHPQGSIRNLNTLEKLNTKQTLAYNLAIKDGKSIFITGPAGTGKSVLLKHIMATLEDQKKKRWAATSSTG